MTYTTTQRQRAEARQRALQRQHEKAREAIPEGFELAPGGACTIPMGAFKFDSLADLVGAQGMAGFVLATSCRTKCWIYGRSYPRMDATRAWSVGAYRCQPGDTIELHPQGRGSGPLSTVKVFPFVARSGSQARPAREPELDRNGLPETELPQPPLTARQATPDAPATADDYPPW